MTEPQSQAQPLLPPSPTRARYLTPEMCKIHLGTHEALHVTIVGERIYGGVYAAYAFPVSHSHTKYIALIHTTSNSDEEIEIGLIRDLGEFPRADADLVRQALARRYFIHAITRIRHIGLKFGFIAMDVETDKGAVSFLVPWRQDRAVDYGRTGKVLIDVDDNRYLIPDLDALPSHEQEDFRRFIYW